MPIFSMTVDPYHSLNKLKWHKDGKKISVGSSDGHIYVYDIGDVKYLMNKKKYIYLYIYIYK